MLEILPSRLRAQPSRTGAVIVTLYGDAIAPRGGSLSLGTLLQIFRALAVADGVVRTAVSRLTAGGWLARRRMGRNSYYRLAPRGMAGTEAAAARIYGPPSPAWGGRLQLVLLEPGVAREQTRQALLHAGWGAAAPGLLVAPVSAELPRAPGTLLLRAETDPATARRLAAQAWPLDALGDRYATFLETFPTSLAALKGLEALLARTLLVHEYRSIVLRDPRLPAELLPENWPGHAARRRVAALYQALRAESEGWLDAEAIGENGRLPQPDPALARTFA